MFNAVIDPLMPGYVDVIIGPDEVPALLASEFIESGGMVDTELVLTVDRRYANKFKQDVSFTAEGRDYRVHSLFDDSVPGLFRMGVIVC